MSRIDDAFLKFCETEDCKMCGSQRCYATIEWLHETGPCGAFQRYVMNNCDEETKTEMFTLHAKIKH